MINLKSLINWKLFRLLLGSGVFAVICIFPYVLTIQGDVLKELPFSLATVLALSLLQSTVLIAVATFVGIFLAKKVHLGAPILEEWLKNLPIKSSLKKILRLAVPLGIITGVLIIGFDALFAFVGEPLPVVSAPIWQGFLASFYGGIVEEILLRLFFMTLLVWILSKLAKPSVAAWSAILLSSILFGLGHLPATQLLVELTPLIIFRALLLNGIGGLVFGWLYWKKGLLSAMIAHFSTDIVLHVLFPLLLLLM